MTLSMSWARHHDGRCLRAASNPPKHNKLKMHIKSQCTNLLQKRILWQYAVVDTLVGRLGAALKFNQVGQAERLARKSWRLGEASLGKWPILRQGQAAV